MIDDRHPRGRDVVITSTSVAPAVRRRLPVEDGLPHPGSPSRGPASEAPRPATSTGDEGGPGGPKLLDQLRLALRARHCSRRTEKAYCHWVRRFIHPQPRGRPMTTRAPSVIHRNRITPPAKRLRPGKQPTPGNLADLSQRIRRGCYTAHEPGKGRYPETG
jgi:hypothetical protein